MIPTDYHKWVPIILGWFCKGENMLRVGTQFDCISMRRMHPPSFLTPMEPALHTAFAMSIAWYIQAVLSAVTSGIRGGLMFSRNMLDFAHGRGWLASTGMTADHNGARCRDSCLQSSLLPSCILTASPSSTDTVNCAQKPTSTKRLAGRWQRVACTFKSLSSISASLSH